MNRFQNWGCVWKDTGNPIVAKHTWAWLVTDITMEATLAFSFSAWAVETVILRSRVSASTAAACRFKFLVINSSCASKKSSWMDEYLCGMLLVYMVTCSHQPTFMMFTSLLASLIFCRPVWMASARPLMCRSLPVYNVRNVSRNDKNDFGVACIWRWWRS